MGGGIWRTIRTNDMRSLCSRCKMSLSSFRQAHPRRASFFWRCILRRPLLLGTLLLLAATIPLGQASQAAANTLNANPTLSNGVPTGDVFFSDLVVCSDTADFHKLVWHMRFGGGGFDVDKTSSMQGSYGTPRTYGGSWSAAFTSPGTYDNWTTAYGNLDASNPDAGYWQGDSSHYAASGPPGQPH